MYESLIFAAVVTDSVYRPKEQSKLCTLGIYIRGVSTVPTNRPRSSFFSLLNGVFILFLFFGQKPRRASSAKREAAVAEHELTMRIVKSSTFETWAFDATSRVDAHNHAIPG